MLKDYRVEVDGRVYHTKAFDEANATYIAIRQYMHIHTDLPENVKVTEVTK